MFEYLGECRNCCSIGSLADGIKDAVGPIVALSDVRSDFVLRGFVIERACVLVACDVRCAMTKIDSASGQRVDFSRFVSCTEIGRGSGEKIVVAVSILMGADVQ
jgi:hypothetical protein